MAVIKASPAPPATTDAFTPREAQLYTHVLINNKAKINVNWDNVATAMNYKDGTVAYVRFRQQFKKHLAAMGVKAGGEGDNGTEGKVDGITDGAGETTPATKGAKKPRTPRKRKAADDGEAGGESKVPKKRAKKDKATKVNAEVTDEPKAKEDAGIKDEADKHDERSQYVTAEVERSEPEEAGDVKAEVEGSEPE